jgi:hypothetical protein
MARFEMKRGKENRRALYMVSSGRNKALIKTLYMQNSCC